MDRSAETSGVARPNKAVVVRGAVRTEITLARLESRKMCVGSNGARVKMFWWRRKWYKDAEKTAGNGVGKGERSDGGTHTGDTSRRHRQDGWKSLATVGTYGRAEAGARARALEALVRGSA